MRRLARDWAAAGEVPKPTKASAAIKRTAMRVTNFIPRIIMLLKRRPARLDASPGGSLCLSYFSKIDTASSGLYPHSMEVNLGPDLQAKLTRLAHERGRDPQALVQEAIERFVNYDEWFLREVESGLAAADRGEFIDHEDIGKLINRRYPG